MIFWALTFFCTKFSKNVGYSVSTVMMNPSNACLKESRYGANPDFRLSAMGQTMISLWGKRRKSPEYTLKTSTIMAVMRTKTRMCSHWSTLLGAKCKNEQFLKHGVLFSALITRYGAKFPDLFPLWGKLQIDMHFCPIPPLRTGIGREAGLRFKRNIEFQRFV